jgi:hypothetical protein
MGSPVSKAVSVKDEAKRDVDNILETLENKLEAFQFEVQSVRGLGATNDKEVVGGRTVMRVSDIRVSVSADISQNIRGAVSDFFQAAQNSIGDDDQAAKESAVMGAQKLIEGAVSALFGVGKGEGKTKKSFVVLFMNNAFVRVDYYIYTYNASGEAWGAVANESGACYLADLAVLDIARLEPQEIDFLLSQALRVGPSEFNSLNRLKFALIQSSILGRALSNETTNFDDLSRIADALANSITKIDEAFGELTDFNFGNENSVGNAIPPPPSD